VDRLVARHGRHASGAPATSVLLGGGSYDPDLGVTEEQLRRAQWAARDLRERWEAAGRRVAAALVVAAQAAPPVPASLGELVWRHRRGIALASDLCSVASLPAGFVPIAGPLVAGGLGLASTVSEASLAAYADGSLTDVALGATGIGLGGVSLAAARVARSPVAGAPTQVAARGVQAGDLGYGAVGTGMTVHEHTGARAGAPPAPAPAARAPAAPGSTAAAPAAPSPALRRLLVAPVTAGPTGSPGPPRT
jgi:hypothetical protein